MPPPPFFFVEIQDCLIFPSKYIVDRQVGESLMDWVGKNICCSENVICGCAEAEWSHLPYLNEE